jgi:hypothetical protein
MLSIDHASEIKDAPHIGKALTTNWLFELQVSSFGTAFKSIQTEKPPVQVWKVFGRCRIQVLSGCSFGIEVHWENPFPECTLKTFSLVHWLDQSNLIFAPMFFN